MTEAPLKFVLLVEDDPDDQEFFKDALSGIGNAVLYGIAGNGAKAIERLESASMLPDLIFMDVNMPLMNGIECIARLKTDPRTQNIPVVMLSTAIWEMEMVRLLGAKAFIKKTGNSLVLREQMQQIINPAFGAEIAHGAGTFEIKPH